MTLALITLGVATGLVFYTTLVYKTGKNNGIIETENQYVKNISNRRKKVQQRKALAESSDHAADIGWLRSYRKKGGDK